MHGKKILGVDPGLNVTGYAVIQVTGASRPFDLCEAGIIKSQSRDDIEARLHELHDGLTEVIQATKPHMMALEQLFSHYERPRTAILMGHARGVFCLAAGQAGLPVKHFEPTKVKKVLTGNGRAPKSQVQRAVQLQLGLSSVPEPADVADAMAIAMCGYYLNDDSIASQLAR